MVIRLQPDQIPRFWEAIKFSFVKTGDYQKENFPVYFRKLLIDLLSSKAQCFVTLTEERKLTCILLTHIIVDTISGDKTLFIDSLYSFKFADADEWLARFEFVKKSAKEEGCKTITTQSNVPRVLELAKLSGFEERFIGLVLRFDGGS